MIVHDYNRSYLDGRARRIMVQGQPRQKVSKTPSQPTSRHSEGCL
jgi:hypothetical protein